MLCSLSTDAKSMGSSPSVLANKNSQPITNCNRKYLCSFKSRIMSPTTYQKSRRIEVQEDKKIPLLMWSPLCSTRKRGYKKVYKFVLIVMPGKRCYLFEKHCPSLLHLETVHKFSLRPVMTAGSSSKVMQCSIWPPPRGICLV